MKTQQYTSINMIVGALAAIANGGAAIMMWESPSNWSSSQIWEAAALAFAGLALTAIGALGFAGGIAMSRALSWQTIVLGMLTLLLVGWALSILLSPTPEAAFSWMTGMLSAIALYFYFLIRHVLSNASFQALRPYAIVICLAVVLIDVGVLARVGWF